MLPDIPKSVTFFLDSHLEGEGLKGENLARELCERGYSRIFLATGYAPNHFPEMPWVQGIVGKEPPWL
jgi:hypothetical protein